MEIQQQIWNVMNYIVESEMEGVVDSLDSYYPTYRSLQDLLDKIEDGLEEQFESVGAEINYDKGESDDSK